MKWIIYTLRIDSGPNASVILSRDECILYNDLCAKRVLYYFCCYSSVLSLIHLKTNHVKNLSRCHLQRMRVQSSIGSLELSLPEPLGQILGSRKFHTTLSVVVVQMRNLRYLLQLLFDWNRSEFRNLGVASLECHQMFLLKSVSIWLEISTTMTEYEDQCLYEMHYGKPCFYSISYVVKYQI